MGLLLWLHYSLYVTLLLYNEFDKCFTPPHSCSMVYESTVNFYVFAQHLFIFGLFNDAVTSSDYMASNDRMINEW
jgi:hypothetical protein